MLATRWLEAIEWVWMVIGGFFLIAYLFWYVPTLKELPGSLRHPPAPFPWHWTLDFTATAASGLALIYLGFRRANDRARATQQREFTPP